MWFYKRKKGQQIKAVIHNDCYKKLPTELKSRFYPAPSDTQWTHIVCEPDNDQGSFSLIAGDMLADDLALGTAIAPTENYSIDEPAPAVEDTPSTDTGNDFGGGSGGGGGAGDSY